MTYGSSPFGTRTGGGLPIRLIIGVVIALIGVVGYFAKTQTNETTGEAQHVGTIQPEDEIALGLQAVPDMVSQMGGAEDPNSKDAQTVARIGQRLAYETVAGNSTYAKEHQFHYTLLSDPKTVNAFALPGGQVFITRALFDRLQNEAQLAGVLGHETGHVIERHGAQHMAKGDLGQKLVTAVAVGASDNQRHGQLAAMAANMANQMLQLKYSRTDELQADAVGLRLMAQLGYDPAEMLAVMQILEQVSPSGNGPNILQTHPYPKDRETQINEILAKYHDEWANRNFTKGGPIH